MDILPAERALIVTGVLLLAISALTGFVQARQKPGSDAHSLWRVAHAGGTAGAVQLIALSAVVEHLKSALSDGFVFAIVLGVAGGTWAFFVGPLLRALGADRVARRVNLFGACLAGPAYLALPLVLLR